MVKGTSASTKDVAETVESSDDDEDRAITVEGSWDRLKHEDHLAPLHNKDVQEMRGYITTSDMKRSWWQSDAKGGNKLDHCGKARARDALAFWAEDILEGDPGCVMPWQVMCVCVHVLMRTS